MKLVTPLKRRWMCRGASGLWFDIGACGEAMWLSTGLVVGFTVFRAGFCDPVYLGSFPVLEAGIVVLHLSGHWGDSILTGVCVRVESGRRDDGVGGVEEAGPGKGRSRGDLVA